MKSVVIALAKLVVTVGLLYFAVRGVDLSTARTKFAELDPLWALAAVAACVLQLASGAARWGFILRACGELAEFSLAFRLLLIGNFFSQTLPSTVGGDGVRLLLLRRSGIGWRASTYSVFLDRVVGLLVLSLMVAASLPWSFGLIQNQSARLALIVTALLPTLGGLAFLMLARIPTGIAERWLALREMKALAEAALEVLRGSRLVQIALASLVSQIFAVTIAWCAAKAIDMNLPFAYAFLLVLPVTLITAVPISIAGWGVREQALQYAFLNAGLNGADGVLISLLFGAAYLGAGLLGGLVWFVTDRASLPEGDRLRPENANPPRSS